MDLYEEFGGALAVVSNITFTMPPVRIFLCHDSLHNTLAALTVSPEKVCTIL
jgi:hypothetical protein